ncbi:MAG: hypothetical protein ACRDWA_05155 [Acidimicrobiia bacterium]
MPLLKKAQAQLAQRLVLAGAPGETASIIAGACYDQRRLSPRFYGAPKVSESDARALVDQWLAEHPPKTPAEYVEASHDSVQALIASIF